MATPEYETEPKLPDKSSGGPEGMTQLGDTVERDDDSDGGIEDTAAAVADGDDGDSLNIATSVAGEKRPREEEEATGGGGESKRLCSEKVGEEENDGDGEKREETVSPCEVSSTSLKSSNGSSTSTKTTSSLPPSSGDTHALTPTVASDGDGDKDPETEQEDTEDTSKDDENEEDSSDPAKDDIDETTSKLLASGISISLIKKKTKDTAQDSSSENAVKAASSHNNTKPEEAKKATNPLEVGPHISVTMINKSQEQQQESGQETPGKFTLSLKSPSDLLMDPSKGDSKSPNNLLNMEETKDSISVSRINKGMNTPGPRPSSAPRHPLLLASHLAAAAGYGAGPGHLSGPRPGLRPAMMAPPPPGPGPPGLQPRPVSGAGGGMRPPVSSPGAAGAGGSSVTEQLSRISTSLADYMRLGLEELLRELSAQGSPEATIKGLQLEMEKMQWRHSQEMAEMKQSVDMMLKDMKTSMEKDTQRTLDSLKKQSEAEKQKAITETKKKQWCAMCSKEAIFYCCWNTSYCDYPCQQAHWPTHMSTCAQNGGEGADSEAGAGDAAPADNNQLPQHFLAGSAHFQQQQQQVAAPAGNGLHHRQGGRPGPVSRPMRGRMAGPGPGVPASMAGMRFHMQPRLPGHGFTRPYFM